MRFKNNRDNIFDHFRIICQFFPELSFALYLGRFAMESIENKTGEAGPGSAFPMTGAPMCCRRRAEG
jgi:hypothetical protein